ncbi:MAG: stage V sporulation protein AD [Clostridia bacterium]|nr:stage V sporulation protein AD [Clostridia bacterium]
MIISTASVAGREEEAGPLGGSFDLTDTKDDSFGMKTWEKAESEMQRLALGLALSKASLTDDDVGALFAGDLLNQCVGSNYGLSGYKIPYFGLYGACSTAAEGIMLSALTCDAMPVRAAAVTSSHYCAAERQFRYPLEYGGQRTPTAQWTVTGSGAFIVSSVEEDAEKRRGTRVPVITEWLPGYVVDRGITDVNNMGAAMAPAAADTIKRYFDGGHSPEEFDMIVTGDLGHEGSDILCELLLSERIDISKVHTDCGKLIYDAAAQDKHAGGSGCGCSAVVMAGHILRNICDGVLNSILFIGTGALMSPLALNQGSSIPGIGHLLHIKGEVL